MALDQSFIFGGNTGETPESLAKKRKVAEAMAMSAMQTPRNVGEGLSAIGRAIAARAMESRLAKSDTAGREQARGALGGIGDILGGGAGPSAPAYPASVAAGGSPTAPAATGVADPSLIKRGLVARGLPEHVADGFLMNFQDESGLNPGINEKTPTVVGSRGGFGLAQWTGPRRRAFESFAADRGVNPADTDTQLDFLMTELQGPEANAAKSIMSAPDAGTAAAAIAKNFLRPAKEHLDSRIAKYTSGAAQPAVQVASLDPSFGMDQAFAPQQFTAEQLKNGMNIGNESQFSPEDQQLIAQRRGPAPVSVPYSGPGARIGDQDYRANFGDQPGGVPAPLSEDERARRLAANQAGMANFGDQIAAPTSAQQGNVGIGQVPAGSGGQPVLDVTQVPQLSAAAGLPFANGQQSDGIQPSPGMQKVARVMPQASATAQSASPGVAKVSEAMLRANDKMLGGMFAPQGQQPQQVADMSGSFPPAPSMNAPTQDQFPPAPAQRNNLQRLMQAASNPWLNDQERSMVNMAIEREYQNADPVRKLQLEKAQLEINALREKPKKKFENIVTQDGTVLRWDPEQGVASPIYQAGPKPTTNMQDYNAYAADERAAGREPLGRLPYEQAVKKAGAQSTTIVNGEGNKFYEELDKENAKVFSGLSNNGIQARSKMGQIDRLEQYMKASPSGAAANLKKLAGDWGIKTDGLDDIQAANALLSKMVPEQRQAGSGAMSDADLEGFRQSLPRMINTPEGNAKIIQTLRGIALYDQKMGEIADQVADRTIKPEEGRRAIRSLPNPLTDFGKPVNVSTKQELDALPSGTQFIAPDGSIRRKP